MNKFYRITIAILLALSSVLTFAIGEFPAGAEVTTKDSLSFELGSTTVESEDSTPIGIPTAAEVYFTTEGGGIKAFSPLTSEVNAVLSSKDDLEGITFDPIRNLIYYCSHGSIYRSKLDGSDSEILMGTNQYGNLYSLAFDGSSGILYGAGSHGALFICNTISSSFACSTVLDGLPYIHGITVDLAEGYLYLSTDSIRRVSLDGSNLTTLVTNVTNPAGIAIDYDSSRIYWADHLRHSIESSDLDGSRARTVVQLESGAYPWGLVIHDGRIYWGTWGSVGAIQSSTVDGEDISAHYEGSSAVQNLAVVQQKIN